MVLSLSEATSLDAADCLAPMRAQFALPGGVIYLDGNSLGPLPKDVAEGVMGAVNTEWGEGLIRSWNDADWVNLPLRTAAKLAPIIGADIGNLVVTDSTSINLFKALAAAIGQAGVTDKAGKRRKILTERDNFPTDNYIAEGVVKLSGGAHEIIQLGSPDEILPAMDNSVAVLMLSHVNYRTGYRHDLSSLTKAAHQHGILVIWDLAHSAGAMPIDLGAADVDFAVGCTYKYLNGGPGSPGYIYVAPRQQGGFQQPLSGWFSHRAPFDFTPDYQPATDISQYLSGTPPVLSMVALDRALDLWVDVDLDAVREKSVALTDYFITLVESKCDGYGLQLITSRQGDLRGSQISFTHADGGYAIVQALIAVGVIGDFRSPNIMRFGFAPLYIGFADVWHAVDKLATILKTNSWQKPEFQNRKTVT